MYINLSTDEATRLLKKDENADWSWSGSFALIEYLEDLEEQTNQKIELDPIAIRCDYSEYSSILEAAKDYSFIPPEDSDQEVACEQKIPFTDFPIQEIRLYLVNMGNGGGVLMLPSEY